MTFQLSPEANPENKQASPTSGNCLHPSMVSPLTDQLIQPVEFWRNGSPVLRFLFQVPQPVSRNMFYAGVHTLSMVHATSHGAVVKTRALDSVLDSNLLPSCLEKLISIHRLQFAGLEIGDDNTSIME